MYNSELHLFFQIFTLDLLTNFPWNVNTLMTETENQSLWQVFPPSINFRVGLIVLLQNYKPCLKSLSHQDLGTCIPV